jgi:transposase
MLTMYQQITVKTLAKQNKKKTAIAQELGCHRNTVANILNRDKVVDKQVRDKGSSVEHYHNQLKQWLDKKVSRVRMWELLKEQHQVNFQYDTLCKYIQKHFPKLTPAFGVQVTKPGEVAEVDFGYAGLQPVNPPGQPLKKAKTWFLSVRLNYSRLAYREIVHDQKVSTFIAGIIHAFEAFGGVPQRLKIDNLRAAVIKNQHYDLQFQPDFLDFAYHCGCVVIPCTPYHPEQKGGVESDIKYIENNFLVERQFSNQLDLINQFHTWSVDYANNRTHGITKKVPSEVFKVEEVNCLLPLPTTSFTTFDRCERKVASNCHVFFQNNYYSVPARLVGQTVTLRFSGELIKVSFKGEEVASHLKAASQGEYVTCRSHLPDYKCYSQTEYQKRYEAKMADIGEYAHAYFKEVLTRHDSYWFRSIRTILGLSREYGNEAINLSLKRALAYHVTNTTAIKNIAANRLYELDLPPKLLTTQSSSPPSTQGPLDRELSYYQSLQG